jgi:hypothetical protein
MKYHFEFPDRFGCIQDTRALCQQSFQGYNEERRHSGIGLLIPAVVDFGEAQAVLGRPQVLFDAYYLTHWFAAFGKLQNQCLYPRRFGSIRWFHPSKRQRQIVTKSPRQVSQSA